MWAYVSDKSISGKISATGGWNDYKLAKLGVIHIDQPGTVTITVKPTKKPGLAVMNLRSITLKPVNLVSTLRFAVKPIHPRVVQDTED